MTLSLTGGDKYMSEKEPPFMEAGTVKITTSLRALTVTGELNCLPTSVSALFTSIHSTAAAPTRVASESIFWADLLRQIREGGLPSVGRLEACPTSRAG